MGERGQHGRVHGLAGAQRVLARWRARALAKTFATSRSALHLALGPCLPSGDETSTRLPTTRVACGQGQGDERPGAQMLRQVPTGGVVGRKLGPVHPDDRLMAEEQPARPGDTASHSGSRAGSAAATPAAGRSGWSPPARCRGRRGRGAGTSPRRPRASRERAVHPVARDVDEGRGDLRDQRLEPQARASAAAACRRSSTSALTAEQRGSDHDQEHLEGQDPLLGQEERRAPLAPHRHARGQERGRQEGEAGAPGP